MASKLTSDAEFVLKEIARTVEENLSLPFMHEFDVNGLLLAIAILKNENTDLDQGISAIRLMSYLAHIATRKIQPMEIISILSSGFFEDGGKLLLKMAGFLLSIEGIQQCWTDLYTKDRIFLA